jgi:hypothetical protein
MPEQRSILVEPLVVQQKDKGTRNDQNLKSSFYASPIYTQEISDKERFETFIKLTKSTIINGNGLNLFNPDYSGNDQNPLPNIQDVQTGGGGLPSTPYTPNLTSPGPGSVNATNQPEYEGTFKQRENISNFGVGLGGLVSPSETAPKIAERSRLGQYIMGKSYAGSDGLS